MVKYYRKVGKFCVEWLEHVLEVGIYVVGVFMIPVLGN